MVAELFIKIEKSRRDDTFCNAGIYSSEKETNREMNPVGMAHINVPSLRLFYNGVNDFELKK
jgi:hypothetical protein